MEKENFSNKVHKVWWTLKKKFGFFFRMQLAHFSPSTSVKKKTALKRGKQ